MPTLLYASQKTHTSSEGQAWCRLCSKAPESVAHIFSDSGALAESKYFSRHDSSLKVLFYKMLHDLGLVDDVPPWHSPAKPKPLYESDDVQAYWDVAVLAEHEEVSRKRLDARIVNH